MTSMLSEKQAAMRDVFGDVLLELSKADPRVLALDGDLANSTKLDKVAEHNPSQFLQMGIAEQNMLSVAAGLAAVGFQPWTCSFAAFISKRAIDQIQVNVAQPKLDVKMVGAYSGLLTGCTGKTHQALEDIAMMRSLAHMVVLAPADGIEVRRVMEFAHQYNGPVYIRLARDPLPYLFDDSHTFTLGKGVQVKSGSHVTIISTGTETVRALQAAELLEGEGIRAAVLHMPSIKPIDHEAIIRAAETTGAIVTAEEHSIIGGLGSAVAEVLVENRPVPMRRVGVRDLNAESGSNEALLKKFGIAPEHIAEAVREVLARKV
ncbi:Transketolase central region [Paenibacillus mucilaginosus 3016]|uniref:Transketolase central region n=1 Tax=Paenibacillus mucilaginosus 3016 TaxID=1116391 RepID=H6NHC4_9BACL|nr:transketolase C-terminal domain-containing protein [Paenibacillus mucilaginosus]AFC29119.1 Transketolase central region [Paenibacillus mucilaginosus 3016]WFA17859.1 transketolase family protein [Paenibacillus mucilaginosus]